MTDIINVKKMIKALGGPKSLVAIHSMLASQHGWKPLSVNTVSGWSSKNYMRWTRLPEIFMIADHVGLDLDLRRFLEGGESGESGKGGQGVIPDSV